MKLRYKLFLSTSLIWILFLIVTAVVSKPFLPSSYILGFLIFGLIVFIVIDRIFYTLIIKRLEEVKKNIELHKSPQQQPTTTDDEISASNIQYINLNELLSQQQEHKDQTMPGVSNNVISPLAHNDGLTMLPNRLFFNEMLNKTLSNAERQGQLLAILLIDLDHFKNINDALGIETGDLVLKQIALRFADTLRNSDLIARPHGDEFIILLTDIDHPKYASTVAEKLLQTCAEAIKINGRVFYITASIGICIYPHDGKSLEDLQKNADIALNKAKRAGGGVYQYFSKEMTLEANAHIKLETALHNALTNNEFVLYYQPQFNLLAGKITGVEALIRWDNPEIGLISPSNFIAHAEENGLIFPIGEWVLQEACRANKSWQNQGYQPITIAVNISPQQFNHPNMVKMVEKALSESGLDPNYLELEITEMTVMDDIKASTQKLNQIKAMGVKICIDDFGTGYTSISYLKQFPIDILKIDQSFIKGIPKNQNDLAISSAIIALGHNLGLQVVAEGVETAEQLQFLLDNHCDLVQGYYFSRPLPEQKMILQLAQVE
ncbi:MAG: putative bifunctional diguanylate cyclase/phosphodiesterase [Gammaproteobacteria bacterium]